MVSVRIVYSDCTETRSTYSSLRGDAIAMVRAVGACDAFQNRKPVPLSTVTLRIDGVPEFRTRKVQS